VVDGVRGAWLVCSNGSHWRERTVKEEASRSW